MRVHYQTAPPLVVGSPPQLPSAVSTPPPRLVTPHFIPMQGGRLPPTSEHLQTLSQHGTKQKQ